MTPAQCRMARAAIEIGVRELAEAAKVSTNTITRFERGEELRDRTVCAIRTALESAGVIFIEENGEGPGVRLRKATSRHAGSAVTEEMDKATRLAVRKGRGNRWPPRKKRQFVRAREG
jgi:transcriptional regulator with XRE-family HTH domain